MLLLKKDFFPAVRAGTKTTTLRFWRRARVRAGSLHAVPGLGRVRIQQVQALAEKDLTADDALADGFADLPALRRALRRLYPPRRRIGKQLYRVRFALLAGR